MDEVKVRKFSDFYATLCGCPDKSVTVRAVLFAAFAKGETVIRNPLFCEDTQAAIDCARTAGAIVDCFQDRIVVVGAERISDGKTFDCKRSGTVLRLLCGLLAGANVHAVLLGDEQLNKRPIDRVIVPLTARGAVIKTTDGHLPIEIFPAKLKDYEYKMTVDSAQVKSALLLSGITGGVKTAVTERNRTRVHTEKMLALFGALVEKKDKTITVQAHSLSGATVFVPNDPSAVAYYLALGLLLGGVWVKGINVSPERAGYLYKLKECGADVRFFNVENVCGEPCTDVFVGKSKVGFIKIEPSEIPSMIDELPVIGLIAAFSSGGLIEGASELRKKESDRFAGTIDIINRCGKKAYAVGDDIVIENVGEDRLPFDYASDDHRLVMTAFVAMSLNGGGVIKTPESVVKSFPDFFKNFYEFNACLIGKDVSRSISGYTHNLFLGKTDCVKNYTYEHVSTGRDGAEKILFGNCFKTINVTVPYKELAFDSVAEKSEDAALARSVNFVYGKKGYTFDGVGLIYSLKLHGVEVKNKKVLVCGAGGAGRSIVVAFVKAGAKVFLHNRTASKAKAFTDELSAFVERCGGENMVAPSTYNGEPCDVVINATSCKSPADGLPANIWAFKNCSLAVDINYGGQTFFGQTAEDLGVPCLYGEEMLFAQSYFADVLVCGKQPSFEEFSDFYREAAHSKDWSLNS